MAQVPTASTCTSKAHGKRCRAPRRGWTLAVPDRQSSWDGGATARLTRVRHGSSRRWSHSSAWRRRSPRYRAGADCSASRMPECIIPEFIAYAKANPGKLTMASRGIGSPSHVFGELFKFMTGVNLVHVPYRGAAPAVTDLLAGQVQVFFDPFPNSMGYIRAGKLRPLAVTTAKRSGALPDLPTVGEFVPGFEASQWYGLGVAKNAPTEIIDRLNKEINAGLADPTIKTRLAEGGDVFALSPAGFGKFIAEETQKWGKVIRPLNIKAE